MSESAGAGSRCCRYGVEHEEPEEDEDHGGSCNAKVCRLCCSVYSERVLRDLDECGDEKQGGALGDEGDHEGLDAAEAVDDECGRGRADHAEGVYKTGEPGGLVGGEAGEGEESDGPGGDGEGTGPLLDQLQHETHPDAETEVEISRMAANGEVPEIVALVVGGFNDGFELLDFNEEDGVGVRGRRGLWQGSRWRLRGGRLT